MDERGRGAESKSFAVKHLRTSLSPGGTTKTHDLSLACKEGSNSVLDVEDAASEEAKLVDEMLDLGAELDLNTIAARYGIEIDSSSSSSDEEENEGAAEGGGSEDESLPVCQDKATLHAQNMELRHKLKCMAGQVRQFGSLLEALEPLPGIDPERLLDVMQDGEVVDQDLRDQKIVQLAKRSRSQRVQLGAAEQRVAALERENATLRGELEAAQEKLQQLEEEKKRQWTKQGWMEGIMAPAPAPAEAEAKSKGKESMRAPVTSVTSVSGTEEMKKLQGQLVAMRQKLAQGQDELKRAQRVLAKELGDQVPLGKAMGEGWRGRAQQIVMLKAKVKQLTRAAEQGQESTSRGGTAGAPSAPGAKKDVDLQAQQDLLGMGRQRGELMEQLTQDFQTLSEEADWLKQQVQGKNARVTTLEKETKRLRESVKLLLHKSDNDTSLIEVLKHEVQVVQAQIEKQ